jgi:outer membrane protein
MNTLDVPTTGYVNVSGTKYTVLAPQSNYQSRKITYLNQFTNNFNSSFSLGLQVPILNGFRAKNNVKLAQIAEKRTEF